MNAISPFAPADMRKPAQALAGALPEAARHAGKAAAAGADRGADAVRRASGFAQAAARVAGQAVNGGAPEAGPERGQGRAGGIRATMTAEAGALTARLPTTSALRAALDDTARPLTDKAPPIAGFAAERAMQAHHRLAGAPPALPAAPAVQADENRILPNRVRAAYTAVMRLN